MLSVVMPARTELEYTPDFLGSTMPLEQIGEARKLDFVDSFAKKGISYMLDGMLKGGSLAIVNSQDFQERFVHVDSPHGNLPVIDTPDGNFYIGFSAGLLPALDPLIGKSKTETVLAGLLKVGRLNGMTKIDGRLYGVPITWLPNKRSIATVLENCGISDLSQVVMPQEAQHLDRMGGTTDVEHTSIVSKGGYAYSTSIPTWGYMNYPVFDMDFTYRPKALLAFCVGPLAKQAIKASFEAVAVSEHAAMRSAVNIQISHLVDYNLGYIAPKNGLSTFSAGSKYNRMPRILLDKLVPLVTGEAHDKQRYDFDNTEGARMNRTVVESVHNDTRTGDLRVDDCADKLLAIVDDSRANAVRVYVGAKKYAAWVKKSSRTKQSF